MFFTTERGSVFPACVRQVMIGAVSGRPGAPVHPPGQWRRGDRRPPQARRTARSHQPATMRPRRAGRARPRPRSPAATTANRNLRVFGHGMRTRAGTRTSRARRRPGGGRLAREGVVSGMQGRQPGDELADAGRAGRPGSSRDAPASADAVGSPPGFLWADHPAAHIRDHDRAW